MELAELLRDPRGQRLYMAAMKAANDVATYRWYDSFFLQDYSAARIFLRNALPEAHDRFVRAFDPLRTRPDFKVASLPDLLDDRRLAELRQVVTDLTYDDLAGTFGSKGELQQFGRFLYRDHPFFSTLQAELTERVGDLVGETVVPTYNFLSLYQNAGVCPPHLDDPIAKYTLDLCIDQNVRWPIQFSRPIEWPDTPDPDWSEQATIDNPTLDFQSVTLEPNQAILFSGSGQWHYRDPMPAGPERPYCTLLFLHFTSAQAAPLVDSRNWADHFDIPELDLVRSLIARDKGETLVAAG